MSDAAFPPMVWLSPQQNNFGVRVLDCREFSRQMMSVTGDPNVAKRFVQLRTSDGAEHRGRTPAESLRVPCDLRYQLHEAPACGTLFAAREMEDKWDIFFFDGALYFVRSWTGEMVFRAETRLAGTELQVAGLDASRKTTLADPYFPVRQVDFLIKTHLLNLEVPHPIPADLPENPLVIAVYSFGQHGRWASFATYEDVLRPGRKFDPDETLMF